MVVAVVGDEGGVLGEDLVEGLLFVLLDGGVDGGLPLGALDHLEEVAAQVADDELALVLLGGDASVDARGEELVEADEEDALAVSGHALGGFDGEERFARAGAAVDDDALRVVEDVEGDALLFGEVVELLAHVVDDARGRWDEVEVAAEGVGELLDGVGLERGALFAGLGGAGELGEALAGTFAGGVMRVALQDGRSSW